MRVAVVFVVCLLSGFADGDDFGVDAILAPADTLWVGDTAHPAVVVHASRENLEPQMVHVNLRIGVAYNDVVEIELAPGTVDTVPCGVWVADEEGAFAVICSLLVEDDSIANDTLRKAVTVLPFLFDFAVMAIVLPDTVEYGEEVVPFVVVTAADSNEVDTSAVIRLRIGSSYDEFAESEELEPGESDTVEFDPWEASEWGAMTADASLSMRDGTRSNDTLSRLVFGTSPWYDYAVTAVVELPDTIEYGEELTPAFVICADTANSPDPGPLLVQLQIDSSYFDTAEVEVDAGECDTVEFDGWEARPLRHHSVVCRILTADSVLSNNELSAATYAILPPGWTEVDEMPDDDREKPVKGGGWLCYDPTDDVVYGAKGNKTHEFYAYAPEDDCWDDDVDTLQRAEGNRWVSAGAAGACDDSGRCVYATGGNSYAFWRYDIDADTWTQMDEVPAGVPQKKVKAGSDIVWVAKGGQGYAYLLKGGTPQFWCYDPCGTSVKWTTRPDAPAGPANETKYKAGSFLVYDGDHTIYCHKARYNELYAYDINGDTWYTDTLTGMPFVSGITGRTKKSGDGACGAWLDGGFYALKGYNTQEFWRYDAVTNSWTELDTIPREGSNDTPKKVKSGADIVATRDGILFALKGNKTLELWSYVPPPSGPNDYAGIPAVARRPVTQDNESPFADGFEAECPRWNAGGTDACYFRETDSGYSQVYIMGASTGNEEVQVTFGAVDHEYPVFSPGGGLLACQFYDTLTDCYQIATVATSSPYKFTQLTLSELDHEYPEWSPDGKSLVCQRDDSTGYLQVVLVDLEDSSETSLTSGEADHEQPSFLSDTLVVYTLSPNSGYEQIACVHLNTLSQTIITSDPYDHENPTPAYDGRRVAFEYLDDAGSVQIGVTNVVTKVETKLTTGTTDKQQPDWSADGTSVYCVNWVGLTSEIGRADTNGNYTAVTDQSAIRDNPDAFYNQSLSANAVIFERVTVGEGDGAGGRPRRPGNGIWLVRHRVRQDDGQQAFIAFPLRLERAAPNPVTDRLRLRWQVPHEHHVALRVYNAAGQVARTLHDSRTSPGAYTTVWDCTDPAGRRLPAGVYFCSLETEDACIRHKLVLTDR